MDWYERRLDESTLALLRAERDRTSASELAVDQPLEAWDNCTLVEGAEMVVSPSVVVVSLGLSGGDCGGIGSSMLDSGGG